MNLPEQVFSAPLSAAEFKVIVALYQLSDRTGRVDATQEEIGTLTRYGRETLRRALRRLEELAFVDTTRTKRNLGRLHKSRYQLLIGFEEDLDVLVPQFEGQTNGSMPLDVGIGEGGRQEVSCLQSEASTGDYSHVAKIAIDSKEVITSYAESTSYFLVRAGGTHGEEEIVVNRWTDDDDVPGVGLFDDEMLGGKPKPKVDKRKASTRGQRPESEWTANDVAAEFAYQVARHFPGVPPLVNVTAIRGALLKYRSDYNTTAEIEMELLRMFFEDEYSLKDAKENASRLHGRYLQMFKTHLDKAHDRLGFEAPRRAVLDVEDKTEYIYSTDGREYENSLIGRRALREHEERLLQNA